MATTVSNKQFYRIPILLLLAPATYICIAYLYRSTLQTQLMFNEGWNAYYAQRAADGLSVYPAGNSFIVNNYPPLSFYLIGLIHYVSSISDIYIGRVISWLSFFSNALLIFLILRSTQTTKYAAIIGALTYVSIMLFHYDLYVGTNDPQLLSYALMLSGLYFAITQPPSTRNIVMSAVLCILAGFIKHNVVAIPISITVWIAICRKGQLKSWIAISLGIAGLGFVINILFFGHNFIDGLTSPRVYSVVRAYERFITWSAPLQMATGLAFLPTVVDRRDLFGRFIAIYAVCAGVIAFITLAGEGVWYNGIFDLVIAGSFGAARAISSLELKIQNSGAAKWLSLIVSLSIVYNALFLDPVSHLTPRYFVSVEAQNVATTEATIKILRENNSPALCEHLALCYWAGKSFQVDLFNYAQGIRTGRRREEPLVALIFQGYFGVIQFASNDSEFLTAEVRTALNSRYQPISGLPGVWVRTPAAGQELRSFGSAPVNEVPGGPTTALSEAI